MVVRPKIMNESGCGDCDLHGKWVPADGFRQGCDRHPLADVRIVDTTCRDGEQMPGISFNSDEKLEIALKLEAMGVEQLETFATYNDSDRNCARRLRAQTRKLSIMGWNRMVKADIEDSITNDVDAVSISTDTSKLALEHKLKMTQGQQLDRLVDCVEFAKGFGVYVCFNAGDATRTELDYLIRFAKAGKEAGGDRFRICDTIGVLTPSSTAKLIDGIMSEVKLDIEFHAHNDFGLAVANALAACDAASRYPDRTLWISTTVNGLGERAGNVPIEVLVMNLYKHYGLEKYNTEHILPLCRHVEKASGLVIPLNYPVVGGNMFTHKSGIHVDGVLKNPGLYEAFDPTKLGMERRITLGKHSGKASIVHRMGQLGFAVAADRLDAIRAEVNSAGERNKRDLTDEEFVDILRKVTGSSAPSMKKDRRHEKCLTAIDANTSWER